MKANVIIEAVRSVTKVWAKQRKAEEREANRILRRSTVLTRSSNRWTLKEAAESVMEAAYLQASSNGELPATARQIMYAARGPIQERTGEMLDDKYFTKTLLPTYLREHPETTANWDVVFDARGHFHEPHSGAVIPLGTLAVRKYLAQGGDPWRRFGAILFIEKEGFLPLLERAQIAQKFDTALMSTKGMSVTAARRLVDRLCGEHGIPLLVLHDFDKAGFSILGGFTRSNDRYRFQHEIEIFDLGLRLADVEEYDLPAESFALARSGALSAFRNNLRSNGATEDEIAFLSRGRRVELNAMDAGQLIEWIERKLVAHGITKVVPQVDVLVESYRDALRSKYVEERLADLQAEAEAWAQHVDAPHSLDREVRAMLEEDAAQPWDWAVRQLALRDR
jgi:hypothetical protein